MIISKTTFTGSNYSNTRPNATKFNAVSLHYI